MSSKPAAALELAQAHEPVRRPSSARGWRDDWFFFCAAWIIATVVAFGFAQTLSQNLLHAAIPRPRILWLHAAVYFGWICVFLTQTALVRAQRVRWHRTLGIAGLLFGALIPPIGIATSLAMGRFNIAHALRDPSFSYAFLAIPFNDMIFFTGSLAAAAWWRKRPDVHRRLVFIATCLLTAAAFARFPFNTVLALRWYAGVDLLLLLGVAYDLARHGRVHVAYALALPPILGGQVVAMWLFLAGPHWWLAFGRYLIG
jgi:uncharacterized membrane protein YhaH (DUF805 family)